jgi:hypothetical protein
VIMAFRGEEGFVIIKKLGEGLTGIIDITTM